MVGFMPYKDAINFDLSLALHDYSEARKGAPYDRFPYAAHFSKEQKNLHYVAATHWDEKTKEWNAETRKTIEEVFEESKPQIVIIEGLSSARGISPDTYKTYLNKLYSKDGLATAREPDYVAHLAMQNNIDFIGGEPTAQEELKAMNDRGYSNKDVMAFYFLQAIPQNKGDGTINKDNFEQKAEEYFSSKMFDFIPKDERITVAEFKEWYAQHNDKPERDAFNIQTGDLSPEDNSSYFHKMSFETGVIREKNVDTQIEKSLNDYDRVMVVYGGGHFLESRPIFEKEFGNPEYRKYKIPEISIDIKANLSQCYGFSDACIAGINGFGNIYLPIKIAGKEIII